MMRSARVACEKVRERERGRERKRGITQRQSRSGSRVVKSISCSDTAAAVAVAEHRQSPKKGETERQA